MLKFVYGVVGCGKTEKLIEDLRNNTINKKVVISPWNGCRGDEYTIKSRNGETVLCDGGTDLLFENIWQAGMFLYVDECQFLTEEEVHKILELSEKGVLILCYGLLKNYKDDYFDASYELFRRCDCYQELRIKCRICDKHIATHSVKMFGDSEQIIDPETDINEEKYIAMCTNCKEEYNAGS